MVSAERKQEIAAQAYRLMESARQPGSVAQCAVLACVLSVMYDCEECAEYRRQFTTAYGEMVARMLNLVID